MEGRWVSEQSSGTKGSGCESSTPLLAYTERFYEVFPYYLAIGMSYEQFWEQDSTLVKYYRKAAQIKRDLENQQAWLQGAYVYEAISDIAPILHAFAKKGTKPNPYRDKPYDLYAQVDKKAKEDAHQKQDDKAKAFMQAFAMSMNKKFQAKGGEVNG